MSKALDTPASIRKVQYSFTAGKIRLEADMELQAAFGGAL
jgi:hypothetical protein